MQYPEKTAIINAYRREHHRRGQLSSTPTEETSSLRRTAIINTDRRDTIAEEHSHHQRRQKRHHRRGQPSSMPTEQVASQLAIKHEQRGGDYHLQHDENSADEGHSTDPVQKGEETIYEEVHAYLSGAVIHWKLPNRKKVSSERG